MTWWIKHFEENHREQPEPDWRAPITLDLHTIAQVLPSLEGFQLGDGGGPVCLIAHDAERFRGKSRRNKDSGGFLVRRGKGTFEAVELRGAATWREVDHIALEFYGVLRLSANFRSSFRAAGAAANGNSERRVLPGPAPGT